MRSHNMYLYNDAFGFVLKPKTIGKVHNKFLRGRKDINGESINNYRPHVCNTFVALYTFSIGKVNMDVTEDMLTIIPRSLKTR